MERLIDGNGRLLVLVRRLRLTSEGLLHFPSVQCWATRDGWVLCIILLNCAGERPNDRESGRPGDREWEWEWEREWVD